MPRTAKAFPATWEFVCPYCESIMSTASGSQFWTRDDLYSTERLVCSECEQTTKIPQQVVREVTP